MSRMLLPGQKPNLMDMLGQLRGTTVTGDPDQVQPEASPNPTALPVSYPDMSNAPMSSPQLPGSMGAQPTMTPGALPAQPKSRFQNALSSGLASLTGATPPQRGADPNAPPQSKKSMMLQSFLKSLGGQS